MNLRLLAGLAVLVLPLAACAHPTSRVSSEMDGRTLVLSRAGEGIRTRVEADAVSTGNETVYVDWTMIRKGIVVHTETDRGHGRLCAHLNGPAPATGDEVQAVARFVGPDGRETGRRMLATTVP